MEFQKFNLVATYVPNAGEGLKRLEYRTKQWDPDFLKYLKDLEKSTGKPVILTGDLNVAHEEIDLKNKNNSKTPGFTKEERQGMTDLLAGGYIDAF